MVAINLLQSPLELARDYLDVLDRDIPVPDLTKDIFLLRSLEDDSTEGTSEYRFFKLVRKALEFWKESLEDPFVSDAFKKPVIRLHPELLCMLENILSEYVAVGGKELFRSEKTVVYRHDFKSEAEAMKVYSIAGKLISGKVEEGRENKGVTSAHSETLFSLTNLPGYNHVFLGIRSKTQVELYSRPARQNFLDFLRSHPDDVKIAWKMYLIAKILKKSFDHDFCPCDLKPDNILLFNDPPSLLLCDNGEVDKVGSPRRKRTRIYAAPESALLSPLTKEGIMWQFGIIALIGIIRATPFLDFSITPRTHQSDLERHLNGLFSKAGRKKPPKLIEAGMHLVRSLLQIDPAKRLTIEETVVHPYFSPFRIDYTSSSFEASTSRPA